LGPRSEDDEILSIPEAAQQLELPERDVRAFLADGSLRGAEVGGRWVTSADAVAELADELDAEPDDDDLGS
jgi:excisionase family DNA binding protein